MMKINKIIILMNQIINFLIKKELINFNKKIRKYLIKIQIILIKNKFILLKKINSSLI